MPDHLLIPARELRPGDLVRDRNGDYTVTSHAYPTQCPEARCTGSRGWDEYVTLQGDHLQAGALGTVASLTVQVHGETLMVAERESDAERRLGLLREAWPSLIAFGAELSRRGLTASAAEVADLAARVGDEMVHAAEQG